jgi:hypothetical protein
MSVEALVQKDPGGWMSKQAGHAAATVATAAERAKAGPRLVQNKHH